MDSLARKVAQQIIDLQIEWDKSRQEYAQTGFAIAGSCGRTDRIGAGPHERSAASPPRCRYQCAATTIRAAMRLLGEQYPLRLRLWRLVARAAEVLKG